jgi:hypothetical protein
MDISNVSSGVTLSILLTSIITLLTSYSGKVCFESKETTEKLLDENKFLYYPVVVSIIIFLIIIADNGMSIYLDIKNGKTGGILPLALSIIFSLFGVISSSLTLDCYNRDRTRDIRYASTDYIYKVTIGLIAVLLFLLRNVLSQFLLSLVAINAFIATYMASQCHKSPASDKFKLSEKYLNYNLYFSGGVSIIAVLLLAFQLTFH